MQILLIEPVFLKAAHMVLAIPRLFIQRPQLQRNDFLRL